MKFYGSCLLAALGAVASAQGLTLDWERNLASNEHGTAIATALDAQGNGYFLTWAGPNNSYRQTKLTKFDSAGGQVWERVYDFSTDDRVYAMALDADGDPVFVGSQINPHTGRTHLLLAKVLKENGALDWSRSYAPGAGGDRFVGYDLKIASDDSLVVGGTVANLAGPHPTVYKFAPDGATIKWRKVYPEAGRITQLLLKDASVIFGAEVGTPSIAQIGRLRLADGGASVTVPATALATHDVRLSSLAAVDESRILFAGWTVTTDPKDRYRAHYGRVDLDARTAKFYVEPKTGSYSGATVLYEPTTGQVVLQKSLWLFFYTSINFLALDERTGWFSPDTPADLQLDGKPGGVVSLGDNLYASIGQHGNSIYAGIYHPLRGLVGTSEVGHGGVDLGKGYTPEYPHLPLAQRGRTVLFGGGEHSSYYHVTLNRFTYMPGPNDQAKTNEDVPLLMNIGRNDLIYYRDHRFELATPPTNGTATLSETGDLVYRPAQEWSGTHSLTYRYYEQGALKHTATVTIRVANVNDAPTGELDEMGDIPNRGWSILSPLDNDSDVDSPHEVLKIVAVTQPTNGEVFRHADRKRIYVKANPGVTGPFEFTYTVSDDRGAKSVVRVTGNFVP